MAAVEVVPGGTGVAAILVEGSGQKHILFAAEANDAWPSSYGARLVERVAGAPDHTVVACDLEVSPGD